MNISEELKSKFDLASMRREAKILRRDVDWEQGREIKDRFDKERKETDKDYFDTYANRVSDVTKDLINKAGEKKRDFVPRWLGVDRFDKTELSAQAHETVQSDHHARIQSIDLREASELDGLLSRVTQRDQIRQENKQAFDRASDRRSAPTDRRSGPRR